MGEFFWKFVVVVHNTTIVPNGDRRSVFPEKVSKVKGSTPIGAAIAVAVLRKESQYCRDPHPALAQAKLLGRCFFLRSFLH